MTTMVRLCSAAGSPRADVLLPATEGAAAPIVVSWSGGFFLRFTAGHALKEGDVYREVVAVTADVAIMIPADATPNFAPDGVTYTGPQRASQVLALICAGLLLPIGALAASILNKPGAHQLRSPHVAKFQQQVGND